MEDRTATAKLSKLINWKVEKYDLPHKFAWGELRLTVNTYAKFPNKVDWGMTTSRLQNC